MILKTKAYRPMPSQYITDCAEPVEFTYVNVVLPILVILSLPYFSCD